MTSSGNARSSVHNSQRASVIVASGPHEGSLFRDGALERPESVDDVYPQDSASNAPRRRSVSSNQRVNGSMRETTRDIRIERTRSIVKDSLRAVYQRPVQEVATIREDDRPGDSLEESRVSSRPAEKQPTASRKKKETIREWISTK